jgi:hypothetical protein
MDIKVDVEKLADGKFKIILELGGGSKAHAEWVIETLEGRTVEQHLAEWLPGAVRAEIDRLIAKHQRGSCF